MRGSMAGADHLLPGGSHTRLPLEENTVKENFLRRTGPLFIANSSNLQTQIAIFLTIYPAISIFELRDTSHNGIGSVDTLLNDCLNSPKPVILADIGSGFRDESSPLISGRAVTTEGGSPDRWTFGPPSRYRPC
ncbi:hypothetical protein EVAR_87645_1 [Eumeta japonica]|uniref:Uncharacterized protein n=1 Tax=Eumeta variegata TaxID=151549 RepID=A0A4C1WI38_EUMVA|nr:hypothetical protein EVAR_87645_1 [Eumeta japonica]